MAGYRIFIVGCPRSGTTLLQSLLGSHPSLYTLPETYLWSSLCSGDLVQSSFLRNWGLIAPQAPQRIKRRIAELGLTRHWKAPLSPWLGHWSEALARCLDRAANQNNKAGWLEKTPLHLRHIDLLAPLRGARFVHIVREGTSVAASLYRVAREHPEHWEGDYSLESCLREWEVNRTLVERWADKEGHLLVRYEQLTEQPAEVLRELCRFLQLPPCDNLLQRTPDILPKVRYRTATTVLDGVQNRNRPPDDLDEQQRATLAARLRFWQRPPEQPGGVVWFPRLQLVLSQGSIAGKARWPYVYRLTGTPGGHDPAEPQRSWQLRRTQSVRLRFREALRAIRTLLSFLRRWPKVTEWLRVLGWATTRSGRQLPRFEVAWAAPPAGLAALGPPWLQPLLERVGPIAAQIPGRLVAVDGQLPSSLSLEQALEWCQREPVAVWLLEGARAGELSPLLERCHRVFSSTDLPPALEPTRFHPLAPGPCPGELPTQWLHLARAVMEPGLHLGLGESSPPAHHPWWARGQQLLNWRHLMRHHTLSDRLRQVAGQLNLQPVLPGQPLISVLLPTCRPHLLDRALDHFLSQTYAPRELIVVTHGFLPGAELRTRLHELEPSGVWWLAAPSDWKLGTCLQYALDQSRGSLIFRMDDDDRYGRHYLEDMAALLLATQAGIVGKLTHPIWLEDRDRGVLRDPDRDYQWCLLNTGANLGMRREVLKALSWASLPRAEDTELLQHAWVSGVPQVSADRFNFCTCRHAGRNHSWTVSNGDLLKSFEPLPEGMQWQL